MEEENRGNICWRDKDRDTERERERERKKENRGGIFY
jgi:hypothetical protein